MSDLFVTEHTPAVGSGHGLRTYAVARALARADPPLDLAHIIFGAPEAGPEYGDPQRFRLHPIVPSRGLRRGMLYARSRLSGVPRDWARGISPELIAATRRLVRDARPDRVVADGPIVAAALQLGRERSGPPLVYCAHNFESGFRHELDAGSPKLLRRFERGLLDGASESWMASERDVELARELCPRARLRHVPNAVDVAGIAPVKPDAGSQCAIFVASFDYAPNRAAVRFLHDEVMPRVWEVLPQARLLLVGRGLEPDQFPDPRVETPGFVPDLGMAYARASCAVVPLLKGGGTPLKFIEALAYGVPVVATSQAAAGLSVTAGRHYLEGDGAAAFADVLGEALQGGALHLVPAGRELAEANYSLEAVERALRPPS